MTGGPEVERQPPSGGDSIRRNAVYAFAGQMSTAAFTAALTIFLTRVLGPAEFGTLALALSITGLVQRPAGGGTTQAAARYIAEHHGRIDSIVGVLGMALRVRLLTASVVAAALFVAAEPIADLYDVPELAAPVRWLAIAFFGQSMLRFCHNVFVALRRASDSFVAVIGESALEFAATVVLVLVIGGATSAALGRAVAYVFGALLGFLLLTRALGRSPLWATGRSPVPRREFMGYAGAMLIVIWASAIFNQLDVLLLGAYLTTSAVGIYAAPQRLIAFLSYPGLALAQGVAPRLARHPDAAPNVAALARALSYVVMLQAGVVAFLLVWAEPLVSLLLGPEFAESAEVLRALTPYVFLAGLAPLLISPLNYAGEGARRIPVSIASVALAAGVDVLLIPEIGILGAAVGANCGFALYIGGHLWLSHRILKLPLRPLALSTMRSVIAAAGMGVVLALVGTGDLSALQWIAGLAGGGAAFLALLVGTGQASPDELRSLVRSPLRALRGG